MKIPHAPHLPPPAAAWLAARLAEARCFLEYGAGGSTCLAAKIGVADIYSVESDPAFADAVVRELAAIGGRSRHQMVQVDLGPTGDWGYPLTRDRIAHWPEYPMEPWRRLNSDGMQPDLVLVDGRFRVACCLVSLVQMPVHALIALDDYVGREDHYSVVADYAELVEQVERMAVFRRGAAELDLAAIDREMSNHVWEPV